MLFFFLKLRIVDFCRITSYNVCYTKLLRGTGAQNSNLSLDEQDYYLQKRTKVHISKNQKSTILSFKKKNNIQKQVNNYWKPGIYSRKYVDKSHLNNVKEINEIELKNIYESLKKYKPEDEYNCAACGYGTCKDMAKAIYNGLNQVNNCHFYKEAQISEIVITSYSIHYTKLYDEACNCSINLKYEGLLMKKLMIEVE